MIIRVPTMEDTKEPPLSTFGGGNNGLIRLAEYPAVYLAWTGHPFVCLPNLIDLTQPFASYTDPV
eukprot:14636533-Ditylum_brightwellii.AAC.1